MAAVTAEASVFGGSTVTAPGSIEVIVGAVLAGDADAGGILSGTFNLAAVAVADAQVNAPTVVDKFAAIDLSGEGTITVDGPLFLFYSDLAGEATADAPAEMSYQAVSTPSGDADTTADADMALAAATAPSGDADLVADAAMALAAVSPLTAEATMTVTAVADDEITADLAGSAASAADLTGTFLMAADLVGAAGIVRAVAIVRRTQAFVAKPEETVVPEERLPGYQPGRGPHDKRDTFRIAEPGSLPSQLDGDAATAEALTPNRVRIPGSDGASREVRRRIASGEVRPPPVAGDGEDT